MAALRWRAILVTAFLLLAGSAVQAQQAAPHIGYVYPAGGRQGTDFQVTLGGQRLDGVADAYVSGGGVHATIVELVKPLTPAQLQELREQVKELVDKRAAALGIAPPTTRGSTQPATRPATPPATQPTTRPTWTAADGEKLLELRKKLADAPKRQTNPSIAETVTLRVTIDAGAEPGQRELRLTTPTGLTNPLPFCIGQLAELYAKGLKPAGTQPQAAIALPAVINGQILPGEVDRYRFKAQQGQHLVAMAAARMLAPYLSDAVPGWFQAALTLYDAKGKELAYADHYRFEPDPVLFYEVPEDGEYTLEIRDTIYRGREDFVYRIALGELPFVTSAFPLGGKAGAQTTVELAGWNLPVKSLTEDGRGKPAGVYPMVVAQNGLACNHFTFAVDTLPEVREQQPNDRPESAQAVSLPVIINGRVEKPGEWHVFRFEGRAGEDIVAEVYARRLGSPLDSIIKLTDAAGKQLALNDDYEDKGAGLQTQYADSWFRATLPADGSYYVHLTDVQRKGGAEYAFRLRISDPRPDFALRVTPSSVTVRGGASTPLTVYALRHDGFTGEITLTLKDAPGFVLSGGRIPANQDQVTLTLKAPATRGDEPLRILVEGRGTINREAVTHTAVAAEDMMEAFMYHHLVPEPDLLVDVTTPVLPRNEIKVLSATPVKLSAGATTKIEIAWTAAALLGDVELELTDSPAGVALQSSTPQRGGMEIVVSCDAAKAKPGLKGNLVFTAFVEREPPTGAAKGVKRRVAVGTLPAIPFEVAAK